MKSCYFTEEECFECTNFFDLDGRSYVSPACGRYRFAYENAELCFVKSKTAGFLCYHALQQTQDYFLLTSENNSVLYQSNKDKEAKMLTPTIVDNWYPKTFAKKIDLILDYLSQFSPYLGAKISLFAKRCSTQLLMINSFNSEDGTHNYEWGDELYYILKFLIDSELINLEEKGDLKENINALCIHNKSAISIALTVKAYERIEKYQKNPLNNKDVFVAMSFHESANEIRSAIKKGIEEAKYSSLLMDEIVHNHQIVPEMLRLIKESRFMIMDITQPNFGAYYEAGYALGLGKEVIITCSEEVWNKNDFECPKDKQCYYIRLALKPHFDIAQKQVLRWKNYKDLTKKLSEWIKQIIG